MPDIRDRYADKSLFPQKVFCLVKEADVRADKFNEGERGWARMCSGPGGTKEAAAIPTWGYRRALQRQ